MTAPSAEAGAAADAGKRVLVTGAGGLIGKKLVAELARDRRGIARLVALDVRETPARDRLEGVEHATLDVRAAELHALVGEVRPDVVVHLAAIVTPPPGCTREMQHAVDVGGTENVLRACLAHGVSQLVVTSSGAAYGYHADNAVLLTEDMPLRGNVEFAYSDHKRIVEELLAEHRRTHPELGQLVLRLGTVLGDAVKNQITDLFEKPVVLGVRGSSSPFTFVWDTDVVACLAEGVREGWTGTYNLVGDGVMTMREIAAALGKPFVALPAVGLELALGELKRRGKTQYGPEQVGFLRFRPVLSNDKLRRERGFRPRVSTREAFERYLASRGRAPSRAAR